MCEAESKYSISVSNCYFIANKNRENKTGWNLSKWKGSSCLKGMVQKRLKKQPKVALNCTAERQPQCI